MKIMEMVVDPYYFPLKMQSAGVYELRFRQNGKLDSPPHTKGVREHLTVIEGDLIVTSGEYVEKLKTGDTARYPADVAHKIEADGPTRAILVVNCV